MNIEQVKRSRRLAPPNTPTDLSSHAIKDISAALTTFCGDAFALYVKTKNFRLHMSDSHAPDYRVLLDEQADQIFETSDATAKRVRKLGGATLRPIGHIAPLQHALDNSADSVTPLEMLAELRDDNNRLAANLRQMHALCEEHGDITGACSIETWIDDAEQRTWLLFEACVWGEPAARS